jgi:hypothetical protein
VRVWAGSCQRTRLFFSCAGDRRVRLTVYQRVRYCGMPKRLKKTPVDFQTQYSAHMAKLGAKGGRIGGKRRLETMTYEQRSAIALKAVRARWTKEKAKKRGAV